MKKLLGVLALATAGTACQPQATTDTGHPAEATKTAITAALPASASPAAATAAAIPPADPLTATVLKQHDLSPVFQTVRADQEEVPVQPLNGFFGADRYRIEFVFTHVTRDPQQPSHYRVQGKNRFKGRITPFAGTLDLERVQTQPVDSTEPQSAAEAKAAPALYTVLGRYELREEPTQPGAGTFRGRVAADIGIEKNGQVLQYTVSEKTPAKGGSILYDGTWASSTGQTKPAVWVAEIFSYQGPQVFSDFTVGERDVDFNPKYARLGWNSYWQNDEWWAKSPKTMASRAAPQQMPGK